LHLLLLLLLLHELLLVSSHGMLLLEAHQELRSLDIFRIRGRNTLLLHLLKFLQDKSASRIESHHYQYSIWSTHTLKISSACCLVTPAGIGAPGCWTAGDCCTDAMMNDAYRAGRFGGCVD
jgi:hypothetical protein